MSEAKKRGLGRGLSALLPGGPPMGQAGQTGQTGTLGQMGPEARRG